MKKDLLRRASDMIRERKHREGWQILIRTLALCVVFCTTYVLVLPAITFQGEPICGYVEHVHTEQCSTAPRAELVNCGIPEGARVLHLHSELCLDETGALICSLPELSAHTHGDGCYTLTKELNCTATHVHSEDCRKTETILICGVEESEGHVHTEACAAATLICTAGEHTHGEGCYQTETLVCEIPESEEHTHTESCTGTVTTLICTEAEHTHGEGCFETQPVACGLEESEGHTHGEGCYTVNEIPCTEPTAEDHVHTEECFREIRELTCTTAELQLHSHTDGCYEGGSLVCGMDTVVAHSHTEECLALPEGQEPVLICGLEEHIHEVACYPVVEEPELDPKYLCGTAPHAHGEGCTGEDGTLICTVPEHAHTAACLVADLDLNADVESAEDWMRSVSGMMRTGNWPDDVVAVAQTQLGYRESTRNLILAGDDLKGYTRYGAWYGDPYGDWCAMYASFCLHYAGVEAYPMEAGVDRWIDSLTEAGFYETSDVYTGKSGDLIFFDHDQKPDGTVAVNADHVGIVVERIPASEEAPAKIKTIEGNIQNQVDYRTYELDDPVIIGYGKVPYGEMFRLTHQGADYTVTVTVGSETGIPDTAQLAVREIEMGTEEYNTYYQQSLAALTAQEAPQISFARFFDISFLVDGVETEPLAPVDIEIVYSDAIAVQAEESGQVVHFAQSGIELLLPDTSLTESGSEEAEGVDTFRFTQNSFSVTGTLIGTQAVSTSATKVNPWEIDNTGNTMYVLYAQVGGRYYALSGANGGTPVQITVSGNTITLPASNTENLFWTFVDKPGDSTDYLYNPVANVGTGRHLHPYSGGAMTDSAWDVLLEVTNDSVKIRGNGNYRLRMTSTAVSSTTTNNQSTTFYVAAVSNSGRTYQVWFDGTLGGMMSYYGAANTNIPATAGENGTAVVELPETWQSSTKYPYRLRGWYDINTHEYYPVNPEDNIQPTATISANTVFYADWIAATYDVGQNNEHVVDSIDTNDFITTHVFDYNVLFNVLSQYHTGTITAASHNETWSIYNNGEQVPYNGDRSLGFAFVDYDAGGDFSYANNRDNTNVNQGGITYGILQEVRNNSGKDLLDLLFNPNTDVIGKYYAGTGNHLFQYMDSNSPNYDGEHDGYYYLDSRLNAASYNQSEQRFYHYNYLERTSDSEKDGGGGAYSDLLPFNSPYIFGEGDDYTGGDTDIGRVDYYEDRIRRPGWEYDAKAGNDTHNTTTDATTNYFFGIRTDIEFFLPNDTNTQDEYGNYGNISTRGEHMVFDFHGDDDVWVYIDGELVLDIGGLHGIMHGRIDFSTGTISYGADGSENETSYSLGAGTHHMTVYYMERGSSQSNCAIYFNIAPRYDLEITKEDIVTANKLNGAVFSIFDDEAMTKPSELWNSFEEHESGAEPTNTFTVVDGVAKCWGISAGKTYYIYETTPPPGYPASDDMIRITLNNRGTATIETTTLHGENGVATEGFAVIHQEVNDTLKIVALTVTNQKDDVTTEVRVEKTWDENSVNLPPYIIVYLTADGERVGRTARLTEGNGWSYTWTGLPKYRAEGIDEEIEYVVEEVFVPDYITVQGDSIKVENYVDWVRVDQMSDSKTFLLVHNGMALTYNGSFGWMDRVAAESDESLSAQWNVTTDHDGFHLKNRLGYALTYGTNGFYGTQSDDNKLNQVFYYLNSRLMVHDHDVYYQFGANGSVVLEDGLTFQLYQKEVITGLLTNIINRPVDEEKQTFVEVSKIWSDGADKHTDDAIVVRLYADGKDTGRSVVLNAANNWQASFDDLPYYQDGTETKIEYYVVEDRVSGYAPSYSEGEIIPGRPVSFWKNVSALEAGDALHRIFANGYSLAVDAENDVTTVLNDLEDGHQQWKVVSSGSNLLLQNVATGRYLRLSGTDLTTTATTWQASAIAYTNGYVTVGGKYLELGSGYAGVTESADNVDEEALRVTRWTDSVGMEGIGYTITNTLGLYNLPETGGPGTTTQYVFGSLFTFAAALMYISKFGTKRRKGGE